MAIKLTNLLFLSLVVATRSNSSSSDSRSDMEDDESDVRKPNKSTNCQDIYSTCEDLSNNKCKKMACAKPLISVS